MVSINNQANGGAYESQTEQNYPWYWHNYNQACSSATPQSPHCYYHHHMCMPPQPQPVQQSSGSNDAMLMQQFIQTQQMLINSISQCNQLLWDQQREINNLNSAVLLVRAKIHHSSYFNFFVLIVHCFCVSPFFLADPRAFTEHAEQFNG